jgi:hypothetical protein
MALGSKTFWVEFCLSRKPNDQPSIVYHHIDLKLESKLYSEINYVQKSHVIKK